MWYAPHLLVDVTKLSRFGRMRSDGIWSKDVLKWHKDALNSYSEFWSSIIFQLLEILDMHQKSDFVTMLCLWKRRNKKIWEDAEGELSVRLAQDFLHNWQQVRHPTSDAHNISNQKAVCKWCKPNAWNYNVRNVQL